MGIEGGFLAVANFAEDKTGDALDAGVILAAGTIRFLPKGNGGGGKCERGERHNQSA